MRRFIYLLLLIIFLAPMTVSVNAADTKKKDDVFTKKANELIDQKESRIDKLIAIHTFVRDKIQQVPTKYG